MLVELSERERRYRVIGPPAGLLGKGGEGGGGLIGELLPWHGIYHYFPRSCLFSFLSLEKSSISEPRTLFLILERKNPLWVMQKLFWIQTLVFLGSELVDSEDIPEILLTCLLGV